MDMKAFLLSIGIFISFGVSVAEANTAAALQEQVNALLDRLALIERGVSVSTSTVLVSGTRVVTTDVVRVRSTYGIYSSLLALQASGVSGTIQSGPFTANGHRWVRVDFASGTDGWVAVDWLKVLPATATTSPAWTIEDISSITLATVATATERYTFTLKNDDVYVVDIRTHASNTEKTKQINQAGFAGDVLGLLALSRGESLYQATTSYGYSDVLRVSTIVIDPIKEAIDDEATVYLIVLGESDVRFVTVPAMLQLSDVARLFSETGYKGDYQLLQKGVVDNGSERIRNITKSKRELIFDAVVSLPSNAMVTVCGPAPFGTVDWGDGKTDTIYGLGCSSATQTISMKHTYESAGSYGIVLIDKSQNMSTKKVTIE